MLLTLPRLGTSACGATGAFVRTRAQTVVRVNVYPRLYAAGRRPLRPAASRRQPPAVHAHTQTHPPKQTHRACEARSKVCVASRRTSIACEEHSAENGRSNFLSARQQTEAVEPILSDALDLRHLPGSRECSLAISDNIAFMIHDILR